MKRFLRQFYFALGICLLTSQSLFAHFPWLVRDSKGRVLYYFGEGLNDRNYKLPASLKEAKISQLTDGVSDDEFIGMMLGHKASDSVVWNEMNYAVRSHYLTVTFFDPESHAQTSEQDKPNRSLPRIPVEVTSFGAVRSGDSVYMFGGHTGAAHSYSHTAQNDRLYRLDLKHTNDGWREVAKGPKLQGLGMVAFDKRLILLGGFTAMNQEGEEHDLKSQSTVHVFDIETHKWSQLPDLPEARSSHDATLIGSTVYVVGGWNIQGKGDTTWHSTAWSMDLAAEKPVWNEMSKPPFSRRAMATVAHDGKLFVIGGMNEGGDPTRDVSTYDPATQTWSKVSSLHGDKPMAGFGASGWSLNGKLVVTTFEGSIQSWEPASNSWQVLGKTKDARFFHRMFPLDEYRLVSLGGANMEEGKFAELEVVSLLQLRVK